jgi:hypothetical protein
MGRAGPGPGVESPAAGVPGGLGADQRAAILERLEVGTDPRTARYHQLVRTINGDLEPWSDEAPAFDWLAAALRAQT